MNQNTKLFVLGKNVKNNEEHSWKTQIISMNIFTPKTSQNHSNFREITYNQTRVHRGSKSHLKTLLTSQTRTQKSTLWIWPNFPKVMAPNFSSNIHAQENYIYNIWDGKFSSKIYIQRSKNKACNNYNIQIINYENTKPKRIHQLLDLSSNTTWRKFCEKHVHLSNIYSMQLTN